MMYLHRRLWVNCYLCALSQGVTERKIVRVLSLFFGRRTDDEHEISHTIFRLLHPSPHLSPMGKQQPTTYHRLGCNDDSAPICDSDCCKISHEAKIIYDAAVASNLDNLNHDNRDDTIHELLVVGAGIHWHALLLRLLSPEPDFLSEKQRHISAEFKDRMRSPHELRQVRKHNSVVWFQMTFLL